MNKYGFKAIETMFMTFEIYELIIDYMWKILTTNDDFVRNLG